MLTNRVVVSPMCQYSAEDGLPNDWHLVAPGEPGHRRRRAALRRDDRRLGREGRITPRLRRHVQARARRRLARIVDFVHGHSGAKIGIQLAHAGRKGSYPRPWEGDAPLAAGGWETIAPSAIPSAARAGTCPGR